MTSENQEPSYYEIALTNRQVLMAFVVILTSVLGAFLCGVWVGRGGGPDPIQAQELRVADASQPEGEGEDLESFRFFTDEDKEKNDEDKRKKDEGKVRKPDLSALMDDEPKKETTLAQDVRPPQGDVTGESNRKARRPKPGNREDPPRKAKPATPPPPPPEQTAPPPPAPEKAAPPPAPEKAAPPPPPSPPKTSPPAPASTPSPSADEAFIVQVFSTHDEEQAKKVLAQVQAEGYPAFIAPIEQPGGTFYRVRIGPFEEKARAERAARGVKKKFKLDTWVTAASN